MKQQSLAQELAWRGFVHQTTIRNASILDDAPLTFYWGVDPSSDSMTVGNLAIAMMVRHFIAHGHKAILLVGGATGLVGDPDGRSEERDLKPVEEIARNKQAIIGQYRTVFAGQPFETVDNYDWFKDIGYLQFLRDVGKHVPMRQMLSREFVQSRLSEDGSGISYAELSYSLIQGYDFLHLYRTKQVTLQVCGADQWGNCIAGVELIRRITGGEAHIWSAPLVLNKTTGVKFGKSEAGAVWLSSNKTSIYRFYQFWLNVDDQGAEGYLKLYTLLSPGEIEAIMGEFKLNPGARKAQRTLAYEVTKLVHGSDQADKQVRLAEAIAKQDLSGLSEGEVKTIIEEVPVIQTSATGSVLQALIGSKLASSKNEARRLLKENALLINGQKINRENFEASDFHNGRLLLRRGKAFKDSVLVVLS